jgi:hypothetical protein
MGAAVAQLTERVIGKAISKIFHALNFKEIQK